jgi:hypothetical protein
MVAGRVTVLVVKSGGERVMDASVRLLVPVFWIVTVCDPLVDPRCWLGKLSEVGVT